MSEESCGYTWGLDKNGSRTACMACGYKWIGHMRAEHDCVGRRIEAAIQAERRRIVRAFEAEARDVESLPLAALLNSLARLLKDEEL